MRSANHKKHIIQSTYNAQKQRFILRNHGNFRFYHPSCKSTTFHRRFIKQTPNIRKRRFWRKKTRVPGESARENTDAGRARTSRLPAEGTEERRSVHEVEPPISVPGLRLRSSPAPALWPGGHRRVRVRLGRL